MDWVKWVVLGICFLTVYLSGDLEFIEALFDRGVEAVDRATD